MKVELLWNVKSWGVSVFSLVDNFPWDGAVADFFIRDVIRSLCGVLEFLGAEGFGRAGRPITGFVEVIRDFSAF